MKLNKLQLLSLSGVLGSLLMFTGDMPHCDKPALVNNRIIKFLNE